MSEREPPQQQRGLIEKRPAVVVVIVVLALLVALIGAIALRPFMIPDGTPDDRLLATMQSGVAAAQTALDETGELPASLDNVVSTMPGSEAAHGGFSYERLSTSDIRLCGQFERASSGQRTAPPFL